MSFFSLPPEINSLRMFIGAGTAPMLQAAAAWDGLAEELGAAAQSFSSVTTGLTGQAWQGAASMAMAAAAAPYAAWLTAAAAQSAGAGGQARAVASMFEAAQAATVLPEAVSANRNAFVQLVTSNLFGQNAPLIAAAESIYEEMWAADVAAMSGYYSGASAVAAQVVPWASLLQKIPGLAGGSFSGGATGNAGAATGAHAGGGVAGGVVGGAAGAGMAGGAVANTGATTNYTGAGGGENAGAGSAQTASTHAGATPTGAGAGTGHPMFAPMGVPLMGGMAAMGAMGASGSGGMLARENQTGNGPAQPEAQSDAENAEAAVAEVETPDAPVEEAEAAVPQLAVLPTTAPEMAAKGAPDTEPQARRAAASGIPQSPLRAGKGAARSATTRERQAAEGTTETEEEEVAATLRPEAAIGELRPREAEEEQRIQVRGG